MLIDLVNRALVSKLDIIQHEILLYSGYLRTHSNLKGFNDVTIANTTAICRILYEKLSEHMGIDLNRPVGTERLAFIQSNQHLTDQVNELNSTLTSLEASHNDEIKSLKDEIGELTEHLAIQGESLRTTRQELIILRSKQDDLSKKRSSAKD